MAFQSDTEVLAMGHGLIGTCPGLDSTRLHMSPLIPITFPGLVVGLLERLWDCPLADFYFSIFAEPILLDEMLGSLGVHMSLPGKS